MSMRGDCACHKMRDDQPDDLVGKGDELVAGGSGRAPAEHILRIPTRVRRQTRLANNSIAATNRTQPINRALSSIRSRPSGGCRSIYRQHTSRCLPSRSSSEPVALHIRTTKHAQANGPLLTRRFPCGAAAKEPARSATCGQSVYAPPHRQ